MRPATTMGIGQGIDRPHAYNFRSEEMNRDPVFCPNCRREIYRFTSLLPIAGKCRFCLSKLLLIQSGHTKKEPKMASNLFAVVPSEDIELISLEDAVKAQHENSKMIIMEFVMPEDRRLVGAVDEVVSLKVYDPSTEVAS